MKKLLGILFVCAIFFFITPLKSIAQGNFSQALGISLKASTNGIGGDVIYNFHPKMTLRLGYETLGFNTEFNFEEQNIEYAAIVDLKTGGLSLLYDFYLLKGVFVTGGVVLNTFQADFDGEAESSFPFGDIEIPKEMIGDFNFIVDPATKVSPYIGIGFGRTLGLKKRFSAAFEIGSYYIGPV